MHASRGAVRCLSSAARKMLANWAPSCLSILEHPAPCLKRSRVHCTLCQLASCACTADAGPLRRQGEDTEGLPQPAGRIWLQARLGAARQEQAVHHHRSSGLNADAPVTRFQSSACNWFGRSPRDGSHSVTDWDCFLLLPHPTRLNEWSWQAVSASACQNERPLVTGYHYFWASLPCHDLYC
jgi:hypothetical protein